MSGATNESSQAGAGAASVAGGAAMLPAASNNEFALIIALVALVAGTAVLTATIIKRMIAKSLK